MKPKKWPKAVTEAFQAWGSHGGKKGGAQGGKARWDGVSAEERTALAKKAAKARWAKQRRATP